MMQHSKKMFPGRAEPIRMTSVRISGVYCVYIPNGRGDQSWQADDRGSCAVKTPLGHDTVVTPAYRHSAPRQTDRQTDTVSRTVTDLSTDLHNTGPNRDSTPGLFQQYGQHWWACIANSRYSYRHCNVCVHLLSASSRPIGYSDIGNVAPGATTYGR